MNGSAEGTFPKVNDDALFQGSDRSPPPVIRTKNQTNTALIFLGVMGTGVEHFIRTHDRCTECVRASSWLGRAAQIVSGPVREGMGRGGGVNTKCGMVLLKRLLTNWKHGSRCNNTTLDRCI